jgi:lysozyme
MTQQTHTVRAGEVLGSIAAFYKVTLEALAKANNISNPNLIYVGQKLVIPGSAPATPPTPPVEYKQHVVAPGEYMLAIALKYGLSLEALGAANNLKPPYITSVGQSLRIPIVNAPNNPPNVPNVPQSPPAGWKTHVVQQGEYMIGLAIKYRVSVEALAAANNIRPPFLTSVGQTLKIPPPATSIPGPSAPGTPANRTYTVQAGDNILSIANKVGSTWEALAKANNIAAPYLLSAGQVLKVP